MDPFRQEMTYEEFLDFPRTLGWKHEYYNGALHRSPAWTAIVTYRSSPQDLVKREIDRTKNGDPRFAKLLLRALVNEDHAPLLTLFFECFDQAIEYAGCLPSDRIKYAHRSLDCFFCATPSNYLDACHVAIIDGHIVGASMIAHFEHGAILQPIFVAQKYRRQGLATLLLRASAKTLQEQGCLVLHSRCNLGNAASTAWHIKCGFIEIPDAWSAGHRANIFSMEAERQAKLNLSTAKETSALAEFWSGERERLELADRTQIHPSKLA